MTNQFPPPIAALFEVSKPAPRRLTARQRALLVEGMLDALAFIALICMLAMMAAL